jgi:MFS family permease
MDAPEVFRALKISTIAGSLGMAWFAICFGVPITMLMEALSGTGVAIGLIVTIQQLSMMIQIPSALFFESMPRRKKLWAVLAIIHRLFWFVPAFVPFLFSDTPSVAVTAILAAIAASAVIGQVCGPMWQGWMADLIPEKISGRFWGIRQSIVTVSFLIATGFSGWILDLFPDPRKPGGSYTGFAIVFSIATILGIVDIVVHLLVPEPKYGSYRKHVDLMDLIDKIVTPLKNPDFRWMSFSFSLWYFAFGMIGSFGIVYLKREFNFTYTELSLLAVSASLGPVLCGILNGYIVDKIGARTFCAILMFTVPFLSIVWFFMSYEKFMFEVPFFSAVTIPEPLMLLLAVNLAAGALCGGVGICQLHLINVLSQKDGRGMAIAVHWTIVGLMSASGPIIGGMVMDYFTKYPFSWKLFTGVPFSFFHLLLIVHFLIISFIAVPLMLKVKVRAGELPIWEALGSLRVGNPLRAVSIVYNIYQTGFDFAREDEDKKEHSDQ